MNVVERLKDQLQKAGKIRGKRTPIYSAPDEDGNQTLKGHAREHITVICTDVLELCELASDQRDSIVRAQRKGHKFGAVAGRDGMATMYADDLFHLIDLAVVPVEAPPPAAVPVEAPPAATAAVEPPPAAVPVEGAE